jgi:hypothetical protein
MSKLVKPIIGLILFKLLIFVVVKGFLIMRAEEINSRFKS